MTSFFVSPFFEMFVTTFFAVLRFLAVMVVGTFFAFVACGNEDVG